MSGWGRRSWVVIALAFSMIFTGTSSSSLDAVAQETQSGKTVNLELIVDSSGSMANPTDTGIQRMESTKRVLTEVVSSIPESKNVNVGFRVYGFKGDNSDATREESCLSSELKVPLDGVDKEKLNQEVNTLQPTGWTPLGYSLQEAAKDFKQPAGDNVTNTIILLTDGVETCGADPVVVAGEIHGSAAGIVTHVIGFGTSPDEQKTLGDIAKAGGGRLYGSNNSGQLMAALFSVLEELEVVDQSGTGDARESPTAMGRVGKVGRYEVSVLSAAPDSTQIFAGDKQALIARIAVTYQGSASGKPSSDLTFNAVGQLNSSYSTMNNSCGYQIPDPPYSVNELFKGGSAEFNVCWVVDRKDVDSLVMFVDPAGGQRNRAWFALSRNQVLSSKSGNQGTSSNKSSGGVAASVSLDMGDLYYEPNSLTIPANTDVEIVLTNLWVLPHDFLIDEREVDSGLVPSGNSVTITVNLPPGTYQFYCNQPGHEAAGMIGTLTAT